MSSWLVWTLFFMPSELEVFFRLSLATQISTLERSN
jgi:hypothetical protein